MVVRCLVFQSFEPSCCTVWYFIFVRFVLVFCLMLTLIQDFVYVTWHADVDVLDL